MAIFMLIVIFGLVNGLAASSDEKRLIKHLLENYEKIGTVGRPVINNNETVSVGTGLALIQILDFDEANQILVGKYYLRHHWTDALLSWEPDDFGRVNEVRLPISAIWKPDIILYNDAGSPPYTDALAVVSSNGHVLWIPQAILKSTCSVDLRHFPSDTQQCSLKFGSWVYNGEEVDIIFYNGQESLDLTNYIASNEWYLIDSRAVKNVKYYPCCPEPFPDLVFSLSVRREATTFKYVLVSPSILLSLLALCIFWLPPDSSHKISLGVVIFVIFFYLLLLLIEISPPANLPIIGLYYGWMMMLMAISVCLSVLIINVHRQTRPVPKLVKTIFIDCLARLLCKYKPSSEQPIELESTPTPDTQGNEKQNLVPGPMEQDGGKIRQNIQEGDKTGIQTEKRAKNAAEWKMVAEILDFIFFVVYLIIIVCLMIIFL